MAGMGFNALGTASLNGRGLDSPGRNAAECAARHLETTALDPAPRVNRAAVHGRN